MKQGSYYMLCEALRRYTRFHQGKALNDPNCWVGLGSATAYKQAIAEGYMRHGTSYGGQDVGPKPRIDGWFALTDKGAAIVQGWMDAGYSFSHVEAGDLPPRPVE
jgi:hypothetical protein